MSDAASILVANLRESAERDAQRNRLRLKPKEAFTLILDGLEVPVMSGRVSRSIDTVADGWTAEIAWLPGKDKALDKRVAPYSYCKAQVYLGSTLVNTGRLYTVTNSMSAGGVTKVLEGWSYTADLVDSTIPPQARDHLTGAWNYEWTGLSVWNICNALCHSLGIGVKTDLGDITIHTAGQNIRVTEPFPFVQAELTETYADLFTKLAFQRGMLVTNDEYGNLFLTCANTKGAPVATLQEGDLVTQKWEAKFDGRKRFYAYTIFGQSGMADDPANQTVFDDVVPNSREMGVIAGDASVGNLKVTAAWKRSKQLAEALTIPFPVTGWYTPRGELWKPNTLVTVVAPSIHVEKGFTFLIRAAECVQEGSGQTAMLSLVPPQVYTGDPIKEPWAVQE